MQHDSKVKEKPDKFNKESDIVSNQKRTLTSNSNKQTKVNYRNIIIINRNKQLTVIIYKCLSQIFGINLVDKYI